MRGISGVVYEYQHSERDFSKIIEEKFLDVSKFVSDPNAILVSATNDTQSKPYSDYEVDWFLLVHFLSFPNGTGACPKGMS